MTIFKFSKTETQLPRGSKHPLTTYTVVSDGIKHTVTVYCDRCIVETGSGNDSKCETHDFCFIPTDINIDHFDMAYMDQAFYWKNVNYLVAIVTGSHIFLNKTYNTLTNAIVLCDPLTAEPKIFLCSNVSRFEINNGLLYCYIPSVCDSNYINNPNCTNILISNQRFELVNAFQCALFSIKNVIKMPDENFCIFGRDCDGNYHILRVAPDGSTIESIKNIVLASGYKISTFKHVRAIFALPDGHIVLVIARQETRLCIFDPLFETNVYEIFHDNPENYFSYVENICDGCFDICYFRHDDQQNNCPVILHFAPELVQA